MLKILERFMIFDQNGQFIYHVTFSDIDSDSKNEFKRVKEYQQNRRMKEKQFQEEKKNDQDFLKQAEQDAKDALKDKAGFEGGTKEELNFQDLKVENEINLLLPADQINQWNRMKLIKMSANNQCFLFEDRLNKVFKVYELKQSLISRQRVF